MLPDNLLPSLSLDCVIFGFHNNELRVLLLKMKNMDQWSLPGGFVRMDKDVDEEAAYVLRVRTGLEDIFLRQFHVFGQRARTQPAHTANLLERGVISAAAADWFAQRFVSIGYYALVDYARVTQPTPDAISECIEWCPIGQLPALILDHAHIIHEARKALEQELNFRPIGRNLLPETFTMPELQSLYETILGTPLDRRNFRRKILSLDILRDTGNKRAGGAHKAPTLFAFDDAKYAEAVVRGFKSGFV